MYIIVSPQSIIISENLGNWYNNTADVYCQDSQFLTRCAQAWFIKIAFVQVVSVCVYVCPPSCYENYSCEMKPE